MVDRFNYSVTSVLKEEMSFKKEILYDMAKESAKFTNLNPPSKNIRSYNCEIHGCNRRSYAKKMCNPHYIRALKGRDMLIPIKNRQKNLKCVECDKLINDHGGYGRCSSCYKRRRMEIIKKAAVRAFGGKCSVCKNKYPHYVYDFHHEGNKTGGVSNMINNASIERIADELSRCVILCANCHRIETYGKSI